MNTWIAGRQASLQEVRTGCSIPKKLCMRADPHKVDVLGIRLVYQQKVATDMALPVIGPIAFERVIQPLGPQGTIICNEQQHGAFESEHVVAPGVR